MDIRKARVKASKILDGGFYSWQSRNEILLSLKKVIPHTSPLTSEKNRKLLAEFEKRTCPARVYEYHEWYRDRHGEWDTKFNYLISLECKMYIRPSMSPNNKERLIKEFTKLAWTGLTATKNKGSFVNNEELAKIAELYPEDLALIIREQYE